VVRALLGQPLCDDDENDLLPAQRAWSIPEGPITEEALLTFWAVSIVPTANPDADRRAHADAVERARPAIEEALRASAELARAALALERERAAGGGPRPSCPAPSWETLAGARKDAMKWRGEALGSVFESGLRDRVGLLLRLGQRGVFDWLRARAPIPAGLAVCERCTVVFEPARKRRAYVGVCDPCHASPKRVPPLTTYEDGRGISTVALLGGAIARWKHCSVCGHGFDVERADRGECSPACKARRKRRVSARKPIRNARDHHWMDPAWDPARVRSARCAGCRVDYATVEPDDGLCPLCEDEAAGHDVYRPYEDRSRVEGWCGPP
jgi:predicted nucleic acid-binding Zn ribbon protein